MNSWIEISTHEEFVEQVLGAEGRVVIDFTADW